MADSFTPLVDVTLSDVFATTPLGPTDNAIISNIYGINHSQVSPHIPANKDHYGYTFFTRPQLNLSDSNIRGMRQLTRLLTRDEFSYHRVVRAYLDPRLQIGFDMEGNSPNAENDPNNPNPNTMPCRIVDSMNAFIPLLTNNLISISGWKDMELPIHTSKEGSHKEAWITPDGIVDDYTNYTLTANFRNISGDPITTLFATWVRYMSAVFIGKLVPYPDYLIGNMQDFNTRIYRITLDRNKEKVQGIMATGVAVPNVVSIGNKFDFSIDKPYNDINAEISIPFSCVGQIWNDEALIRDFNTTVQIFNPYMTDSKRSGYMVLADPAFRELFKNECYPYINEYDYNLEWWIPRGKYNAKMQSINNIGKMFKSSNAFTAPLSKVDGTKVTGFTNV